MKRICFTYGDLLKKTVLFVAVLVAFAASANAQNYTANGSTVSNGGNCYTLTPNANGQNGSLWSQNRIDLRYNFDIKYSVYLGNNPGGADGMAFVLQRSGNTIQGSSGSGMGYGGISPSIEVEYDTYVNSDYQAYDPLYDHLALMVNGEYHHYYNGVGVNPVPLTNLSGGSVKDGQYHTSRIVWNATSKNMTVYFDGVQKFTYTNDIVLNYLGNDPAVYFGFTASTGGLSNQHAVCIDASSAFQVYGVFPPPTPTITAGGPTSFCAGGSVNLAASSAAKNSLQFNGSNYVEAASTPAISLTNALTVEAWVKTDAPSNTQYIVSKGRDDLMNGQYGMLIVGNKFQFHLYQDGHQGLESITTIQQGVWYHVAGTWDGVRAKMYVNGVLEGSAPFVGTLTPNAQAFQIGRIGIENGNCGCSIDYPFIGEIDEVRIWNTARTDNEIQSNKNGSVAVTPALAAYYKMDEGSGTTTADVANGNTAGLINNPSRQVSGAPINYASYAWSNGANTPTIIVSTSGSYNVTVTDANGNTGISNTITVTANPAPSATITVSGSTNFCPGGSVTLTANTGTSYAWSNGAQTQSINATTSGSYSVTVTNANGCSATSAPVTVNVVDLIAPVPNIATLPVITGQCSASVTAPTATDNCSGILTATTSNPTIYNVQGTYSIVWTYTDASENTSTQTQTVIIKDDQPPVIINCPGSITQNTDLGKCGATVAFSLPALPPSVDQQITDIYTGTVGADQWQSFTAGKTGSLTQIDLSHNGCISTSFNLTIYSGTGTGGTVLYSGSFNFGSFCSSWFSVAIPAGSQPQVTAGQTYTFRLQGSGLSLIAGSAGNPGVYYSSDYGTPPWKLNFISYVQVATAVTSASDNCSVSSLKSNYQSGEFFPVGTTLVTYTATDVNGNSSTCSFNVIVIDNEKPIVRTNPLTVILFNGSAIISPSSINNGSSDNCGIASMTLSKSSFNCANKGINNVTLTITDVNGNAASANAIVTVIDDSPPVPNLLSLPGITGQCAASATAPTATDGCGNTLTATTTDLTAFTAQGNFTINWVYTAANGKTTAQSQQVIIADNIPPAVPILADVTGECSATVGFPSATDNCKGIVQGTTSDALTYSTQGTHIITWTFNDGNNNISTATQRVIIKDVTAPVQPVLADVTGECSATAGVPSTTDNCKGSVQGTTSDALTYSTQGTHTITWTFNDGNNNISTATQRVIVKDVTPPTITIPAIVNVNTDNGKNSATNVNLGTPVTGDNCGVATVQNDAPNAYKVGNTTVTWTVTDIHANSNTITQTVTVTDNQMPTIKTPSSIIKNNDPGVCGALVTYDQPLANDNVSSITVSITEGGGDGTIEFTTPVTNNVSSLDFISSGDYQDIVHGHGTDILVNVELFNPQTNTWTVIQTIQTGTGDYHFGGTSVNFPTLSQVSKIRFTASQTVRAAFHLFELAVNLNSIGIVQKTGLPSGSIFPIGSTLNTFEAVDVSGNVAASSFTVTVLDSEKPIISGYTGSSHNADANGSWTGSASSVSISDNCAASLVFTEQYFDQRGNRFYNGQSTLAQGTIALNSRIFPLGVNTVLLSARDAAGNVSEIAKFNITVTDITFPTIVTSGNMTQTADPGVCAAYVKVPLPFTADNCSVQSVANSFNGSPSAAGRYPVGTTVVTWTVTDGSGNKTTATQTITVTDNEPPVIVNLPVSIIQTNDAGGCGAVVTWDPVRATDNCGLLSFVSDHQSGETFPFGVTTVTFTARDKNNNTSTASFTITITDNEAPKVITKPVTVTLVNGAASILASDINNGSTDNCGSVTLLASKTSFSCADVGINQVTLTVTDQHGNVSNAIALVTVVGEIPTSSITVTPSNSVYTGGVPTDIYLGYGPQGVTLTDNVVGITPITYSWVAAGGTLTCTTCANPAFTPTVAGYATFAVTATNKYGCKTVSNVSVCVRDIRVINGGGKVAVCHTDLTTGATSTLSLATGAVANQLTLNPQDKLGTCGLMPCVAVAITAAPQVVTIHTAETVVDAAPIVKTEDRLSVKVSPNPSNTVFTFVVTTTNKKTPVHVRLFDAVGRLAEGLNNAPVGASFTMGEKLGSGVYYAEVLQGKERVVVKLIKQVR